VRLGPILLLALAAAAPVHTQPEAPRAGASFDVREYQLDLDLDVDAGTIVGRERIDLTLREPTASLVFDSGALLVDTVESDGVALPFALRARQLIVTLPPAPRAGDRRRLSIAYHGAPRSGLTMLPSSAQAYTTFSTSQWMVAVDAPDERATLDLQVTMPAGWLAAGSGVEVSRRDAGGRRTIRWRQEREVPSFTFGFVAGDFAEAADHHGTLALRYLGRGFSEAELRAVFRDTPAIAAFFEERSGVPYPGVSYAQALVAVSGGQELAGLSHVSDAYGRAVLLDAGATSLIAHELAHQWWGILVTNRAWTHFWLNEGFATFMAAAYRERAHGREAYVTEVQRWRRRLEELRAAGHEKPLVFTEWNRPTADDRALVYQKGALLLHELRETLGDQAFWDGIRAYTREFAGTTVTTDDFARAMERSSGRRLDVFFDRWVYLR
jgi:aminopeptidase N